MAEQPTRLRFDIYERIRLPEEKAAIRELEEIQLIPFIDLHSDEEQITLQGNLRLSGRYLGEQEDENTVYEVQQLEHYIPVQITLPMYRTNHVEDIGLEIENFDVDLTSERSLNITGVLALRGIKLDEVPSGQPSALYFANDEMSFIHHETSHNESFDEQQVEEIIRFEEERAREEIEQAGVTSTSNSNASIVSSNESEAAENEDEHANAALEPQLSFSAKSDDESDRDLSEIEEASTGAAGWKNLFLASSNNEGSRKVKICIVQKEETIELIAARYKLNPKEIVMFNRMDDERIDAGQVLYIPV